MLASVCHFLADEPRDLLLEFGIGDLIGVTPDRADKELFPSGNTADSIAIM
ncbi:hypothetical protein L828_1155 [Mycobacteroides abscessus MAB_030201_1061]|nr:hypothetical protein L828_1155 [Mycobacteroides abscessus MAB_030201_1061]